MRDEQDWLIAIPLLTSSLCDLWLLDHATCRWYRTTPGHKSVLCWDLSRTILFSIELNSATARGTAGARVS